MKVVHTLEPIYDKNSVVLILGSMPSKTSREAHKYYGNIYNRFWKIMEKLYGEIGDWKEFLLKNHIALWDVIASCDIKASSDSSIKNVVPNDIPSLISKTQIRHIFVLGNTAYDLFLKYFSKIPIKATKLPSPSSANAKYKLDDLVELYKIIKEET